MTTFAAIDCGTHSTRLLISQTPDFAPGSDHNATPDPNPNLARSPIPPVMALERRMTITNLGQDLAATGQLHPEAIARTSQCLREYRELLDAHQVDTFKIVATSAARDAANTEKFFAAATEAVGQPPVLLSGADEAKLAYRGAAGHLDPKDGPYLVCDIGGGSTEFAVGSERCEAVWSADVGSSRLTQQYISHDPALPEELTACLSVVQLHLDDLIRAVPAAADARQLVGLAGTVTTAAAVELGLSDYNPDLVHHFHLTRDAAEDVFRTLAVENREQRLANPGLHPGRADVIVGGLCVLVKIMRYFEFESCLVSESDLLDGIIEDLVEQAG